MPTIQPATVDDVDELMTLVHSAYRGEGSKVGWTTEADILDGTRMSAESMKKDIENTNGVLLKYSDVFDNHGDEFPEGERILGCVYLEKVQKMDELKCYLGLLTVSPELQGRGIGKQLVQFAHDWARNQGCASLIMTVISCREELVKWYKKLGFVDTGERKPFFTNPENGIPKRELEFAVLEKKFDKLSAA